MLPSFHQQVVVVLLINNCGRTQISEEPGLWSGFQIYVHMWNLVQVCCNEYWRRVPGLVLDAGPLGLLIGEYVKPGYKFRQRPRMGLPELRTKQQERRTKKQAARTKKQVSRKHIQEICVCHCLSNQGIRPWQVWAGNSIRMLDRCQCIFDARLATSLLLSPLLAKQGASPRPVFHGRSITRLVSHKTSMHQDARLSTSFCFQGNSILIMRHSGQGQTLGTSSLLHVLLS